ncbi:hypothetical protein [Actinokineospora spheciospongiae]|uniref:hypothetical protein n=1 Tax=Actinokineospora spheciospongiae TaxID=909613 RepID=UPI000D716AB5|nr:hypothetical protein [Actinokineospora spheciospongiae]PWW54917.1 hypothetical protein DFQ13_113111 [Actinokineospora spheciospongiae]
MNVSETRKRRRLAVKSALAAVVLGAAGGGIYYSTSAATAGETPVGTAFGCVLPGGDRVDVPIEFGVGIPDTAAAGAEVVAKPSAKIALPATAVDKLRAGGETALDASLTPTMTLVEGATRTDLKATPLAVKAMTLPAQGALNLTLEGAPVAFTPKAAGTAQVELTGLTAQMVVGTTEITCAATTDSGALGTFEVTAAAPAAPQAQAQPAAPPVGTLQSLKSRFKMTVITKIKKVGAEVTLKGKLTIDTPFTGGTLTGEVEFDLAKDTYMVVFRFIPVLNDIQATQNKPVEGTMELQLPLARTKATATIDLNVSNIRQGATPENPNGGVNLGVLPGCKTASPLVTQLNGDVQLAQGVKSELNTVATIPPFTGCRTAQGEDLSRLMTGLVSGPDNPVRVILENECVGCTN